MRTDETVYRRSDFFLFLSGSFLMTVAMQVQSVAIGWQIYEMAHSALALGLVGLSLFLPMFLLILPAGELSDRTDQRKVFSVSSALQGICALLFLGLSLWYRGGVWPYYAVLALFGAARGLGAPSGQSLLPFLVPIERLPRSIALNSSFFTVGVIVGPALGGFLYALGPRVIYSVCAIGFLLPALFTLTLGGRRNVRPVGMGSMRRRVAEGIAFVRNRPIILGAISLDLFAVLLGGATALLPVFARDILHTGPEGLGLLRSAPAVGAAAVALLLARRPIERYTGRRMFAAVALFVLATVFFGLSRNFWLSLGALLTLGGADMISVFVRQSLITYATPDDMRGRVGAVNMMFIGASNELGEFESGLTAFLFGTVPAVILGGLGTLVVVGLWMKMFPPLRRIDRLHDVAPTSRGNSNA